MNEKEALHRFIGQYLWSIGLADNITGKQLRDLLEPLVSVLLTKDWHKKAADIARQIVVEGD